MNELKGLPGFKISHLNIRSLTNKIDQLRIDLPNSGFDIFTISETWLNHLVEDKLVSIQGYSLVRADRKAKRPNGQVKVGGGLGIYTKTDLQIDSNKYINLNISTNHLELQWAIITRPHTKSILIGNVYRPPSSNLSEALKELEAALQGVTDLDKYETLIMGDFNADYSLGSTAKKFIKDFEHTTLLKQIIQVPTCIAKQKKSIIDLVFTNVKYCTSSGVINYNISDHKPIYIIKKKPRNIKKTTTFYGRTYRNFSAEKLQEILVTVDTRDILNEPDPNRCWSKLYKVITEAADKLCPIIELKIRDNTPGYLNKELLELQHDRDYFVKKADDSGDPGDRFIANCIKKIARAEVRKAKAHYCQRQIEFHKKEHKKLWRDIKEIDPEAKPEVTNLYDEESGIKILETELPESINNFFVDIGVKLASKFSNCITQNGAYINTIKANTHNYDLEPTTQEIVKRKITQLSNYKSSGLVNISSALMKGSMNILINEFTYLYNLVISTGIFPDDWKIATVTPIPKVSNPRTCGELRPISILPTPGKIMEQILHDQIKQFLEASKYLIEEQFGFRQNKSTTKALARLLDSLLTNADRGELTVAVFLDFKKAFDTINHKLLIHKLNKAGLGPKAQALIANYLTNRKQKTKLKNIESNLKDITTGVPQGSTLGPLLFLIFINDMPSIAKEAAFTLFADDAVLILHGRNLDNVAKVVQEVLDKINDWCRTNKLTLNASKTEYVIYGTKKIKSNTLPISLRIGENVLREVDSYKYLGTIIDSTLNANLQLAKLNQLVAMKMTTFRRIRYFISEKTAIMLYKALILPIIDYNDIIYSLLTKQQLDKLQRTQNHALRTVFRGKILSVAQMHDQAKVNYLSERRNLHLLNLMYDRSLESEYIDNRPRITRQGDATLLNVPHPKTRKLEAAPIYMGSVKWNELPPRVRKSDTKIHFKYAINAHYSALAAQPLQ